MNVTEDELKAAIASILHTGLVRIRGVCRGHPDLVHAEAHHLHNLSRLLASLYMPLLKYYADIKRRDYLHTVGLDLGKTYEEYWKVIDDFLMENRDR
jgi:hypothetical protein